MHLPADIKEIFFETLSGDKALLDFEEWLYADRRLETILPSDDYLDLISYGYRDKGARFGLYELLEKHIDKGEYEKWQLLKKLHKALQQDDDFAQILMSFYDSYCNGYKFLDNLGLGYGLMIIEDSWYAVTTDQQQTLINDLYPDIEQEIKKVIGWLEDGKVILTGIMDEYNHYQYIDDRVKEEKEPTAYKIASVGTPVQTQEPAEPENNTAQKPWWKFW